MRCDGVGPDSAVRARCEGVRAAGPSATWVWMGSEGAGTARWRMLIGSGPLKGIVLAYGALISLDKEVLGRLG
jgi:hypothetical protein